MNKEQLRKKIDKKHWHILDAWLDGCEVYVIDPFSNNLTLLKDDFIDFYAQLDSYVAILKSLENCYCEANELHYNELMESNLTPINFAQCEDYDNGIWYINNTKEFDWCETSSIMFNRLKNHNQIQYNKQLKQWTYCPYKEKENSNRTKTVSEEINRKNR